ncbi:hypothetical protein BDV96DRAFT_689462 [Lophiotrema nucula]|uniref:Uncharacterized protein n=1 Tax=Lophiotrema nucula TaxID=690887 RepID=A0A6A5YZR4_9PLEO|nr:hypothetical protein BDV96DRAFT_689462 [Lophiotrema nucula]
MSDADHSTLKLETGSCASETTSTSSTLPPSYRSNSTNLEAQWTQTFLVRIPKSANSASKKPPHLTFNPEWYNLDSKERERRLNILTEAIDEHLPGGRTSDATIVWYLMVAGWFILSVVILILVYLYIGALSK